MVSPRFVGWSQVAQVSFTATDREVTLGPVTLNAGDDTLWVKVTQVGGESPWPWSFGLLSWRTNGGRELGTVKAYGHLEGETYQLRTGLSPVERGGQLVFEPRSYNLGWIKSSGKLWTLRFDYQSGTTTGGGAGTFAGGFVNQVGAGLELARVVFP
jgi:hypothetical protein